VAPARAVRPHHVPHLHRYHAAALPPPPPPPPQQQQPAAAAAVQTPSPAAVYSPPRPAPFYAAAAAAPGFVDVSPPPPPPSSSSSPPGHFRFPAAAATALGGYRGLQHDVAPPGTAVLHQRRRPELALMTSRVCCALDMAPPTSPPGQITADIG